MTSPTSGTYVPRPARGDCPTGKVQYSKRKQAKARAREMNDSALGVYRCGDCDWFHVGHRPQRVRNGEVDKAAWLGRGAAVVPTGPRPFTPADMARLAGRREQAS